MGHKVEQGQHVSRVVHTQLRLARLESSMLPVDTRPKPVEDGRRRGLCEQSQLEKDSRPAERVVYSPLELFCMELSNSQLALVPGGQSYKGEQQSGLPDCLNNIFKSIVAEMN